MPETNIDARIVELDHLVHQAHESLHRMQSLAIYHLSGCGSEDGLNEADFDKIRDCVLQLERTRDELKNLRKSQRALRAPAR